MAGRIFISYSHLDAQYCSELATALEADRRLRDAVWYDRKRIEIGDRWDREIEQALAESSIVFLLVSQNFLNSNVIEQQELPAALRRERQRALKIGIVHVGAVAPSALRIPVDVDGKNEDVDFTRFHGVNAPDNPLRRITNLGDREKLYAAATEWASRQWATKPVVPPPSPPGEERHELAVFVETEGEGWRHRFFLATQPDAIAPQLDSPPPVAIVEHDADGETLFALLFGRNPERLGHLMRLAFASDEPVAPTYAPLRVRLLSKDARLYRQPWGNLAYQGQVLRHSGWTVEMHCPAESQFPEYPRHVCYFPGRVIVAGEALARSPTEAAPGTAAANTGAWHFDDLQRFFQRFWRQMPEPALASDPPALRAALRVGSTRLLYYFGPASADGLLFGADILPWAELADHLGESQSVSVVFLNLVGDAARGALAHAPRLLHGVKGAVLWQCNYPEAIYPAANAGLAWLDLVFRGGCDPVVALHRQAVGHFAAWTRYSYWQTIAPKRLEHPDLVKLLLDRHEQRDALLGARDAFFTYATRTIHHVVALGTPGCLTGDFPQMIRQHLARNPRQDEVYFFRSVDLHPAIDNAQQIDDVFRRRFLLGPGKPLLDGLIDRELLTGTNWGFLVLAWRVHGRCVESARYDRLLRAVAAWCGRLADQLGKGDESRVRVLSIVALETAAEQREELAGTVERLIEECDAGQGFHFGELRPLSAVRRIDLRNYFADPTICTCDERYRHDFPDRLLAGRSEMPFDEAVATIRRGDPCQWNTLFAELADLKQGGEWPPVEYDPDFWSKRDAR